MMGIDRLIMVCRFFSNIGAGNENEEKIPV